MFLPLWRLFFISTMERWVPMCKVSVIIPVYNVEKYLPDCLNSVLGQTLTDLEVICIDDHSPDRCGEILDEYASRDGRVFVLHLPENHRQGYGRNRGLERAAGQYVYFLDSDDMIEPEALEELTVLADRERLDAVFFDSRNIFESDDLKSIYMPPASPRKGIYRDEVYSGKDLLDDFLRQNEWTCYPQRIFWRRAFLQNEGIRYPEGSEHEDEYFAFAGILAAERARYVRKQYFILRTRANSVMTSGHAPKNFHGYLMNYYYMNRFVAERGISSYGARKNIARMLERIQTLYKELKDDPELAGVFVRDPDRLLFGCFISCFDSQEINNTIDQVVLERIRKHSVVYIFGAKLTGIRFCEKLERTGDILIGDFLVKDKQDAPEIVMGRRVYELDEAVLPKDAIVVVATKQIFWEETRSMLEERNIPCVFHRMI